MESQGESCAAYQRCGLRCGGLLFGGLLGEQELGHVEEEGRDALGQVQLRDFVGLDLLQVLSHDQLLGAAQTHGCAGRTGIILKTQSHGGETPQSTFHVC